ncbi:MAG: hypothetical protein RLZZ142_1257 [Verrucomicrobiota bacterium]
MKQRIPFLVAVVLALCVFRGSSVPRDPDPRGQSGSRFPASAFGRLPAVAGGRIQPLDSIARNSLLQLREKQRVNAEPWKSWWQRPRMLSASEWLMHMFFAQKQADALPVLRIDHPDVKGLLELPMHEDPEKKTDGKHFAWSQIQPKFDVLREETRRAWEVQESARSPYERAVLKLWEGVAVYRSLQNAVQPPNAERWEQELRDWVAQVPAGREAAKAQQAGQPFDQAVLERLLVELQRAEEMLRDEKMRRPNNPPLVVAPYRKAEAELAWGKTGEALFDVARGAPLPVSVQAYAAMGTAFRAGDAVAFSSVLTGYQQHLTGVHAGEIRKAASEQRFNHLELFYRALVLYVLSAICVLVYMLAPERLEAWRASGVAITGVALVVHSAGLVYRMLLEGRPPVTNLYSSAVFIGWGACVLGLLLERVWRNGIGAMVSAVPGFLTLIIAHHLSLSGDTMEMMRAVLDTNFWLATHVVVVTLGYSATFVAGALAMLYVLRGFFSASLTGETAAALSKMVYGILCFATLFSFVGTVLGGIWADQSWGRFWGWDAKENGALMIVLWNATFLHARWGGLFKERGLMALALGGNIVTAWSWFGVNMLGIGLHSYGFMSAAFHWLMGFVGLQLALILLLLLPRRMWRSRAA